MPVIWCVLLQPVEQGVFCTNEIAFCRLLRTLGVCPGFPRPLASPFSATVSSGCPLENMCSLEHKVGRPHALSFSFLASSPQRAALVSRVAGTPLPWSCPPGLRSPLEPGCPPTRWGVALTPEDWGNEFQVQVGMGGGGEEEAGQRPWFVLLRP